MRKRSNSRLAACMVAFVLLVATQRSASAQVADPMNVPLDPAAASVMQPLEADFKGTVGGGLVGAELGFVVPALLGVRAAWAYIVFPVLGAAGGSFAGYYALERGEGKPEAAVALLITGMALVIPAAVVTLAATEYEPDTEVPLQSASALRKARAAADAGPGLVRWSRAGLLLAPPGVALFPGASGPEAGGTRGRTVRVPIMSGVF